MSLKVDLTLHEPLSTYSPLRWPNTPTFVTRVRKELDAVCGDAGRLPTFADQEQLPLITACVKEALRWQPFVESGLSSSDFVADSRRR